MFSERILEYIIRQYMERKTKLKQLDHIIIVNKKRLVAAVK